ncbi:MAG: hypothetical protein QNJ12_05195 [Ilumatobacter sp.]|uniref:hypothetical protein n=1 Tax=Ilumatobacter sp. TaxID=1967498 RepID=UPI002608EE17|nr:hypothetical protein [Ilumatobacter sp.]MDJ0768165.1 hypothetical protein [Ilumatobacter sp.]
MTMSLEHQLAAYGDTIDDAIDHQLAGARQPESAEPPATLPEQPVRRSRRLLIGAAAAVAVGVAGSVVAFWPGSSSPAWADWAPVAQPVPVAEIDAIDSFCRAATNVGEMEPLIYDVRGSGAVAIYGDDTGWLTCHAQRYSDGEFRLAATTSNRGDDIAVARAAVSAGAPVTVVSLSWQGDPAASLAWGVRAAAVDAIEIATVHDVVEASSSGDIWVGWWPTDDAATARVHGLDASGTVLAEGAAGEFAPALPDPSAIATAVAHDGTALAREILADGFVTWPEFVSALDAWQACVAADGYDLTIEVDHATRSYRVISSPIVSVETPEGEPDDQAAHELLEPINDSIMGCLAAHVSPIETVFVQQ